MCIRDSSLIADIKPTFSEQGRVNAAAAKELGLKEGTPITYRAGDQPNNALSLNVFNPGEIASTAGTSGVVYGVNGEEMCIRDRNYSSHYVTKIGKRCFPP